MIRRPLPLLAATLLGIAGIAAWAAEPRPAKPEAGLYIKLPDGWVVPAKDAPAEPPAGAGQAAPSARPLMVFAKYPATHPGFIPKIRVFYQPIPADSRQLTAKELLALLLPGARRVAADMKLEGEIAATTVSGLPAADASWLYTLDHAAGGTGAIGGIGAGMPLRARLVLVRHGDGFFTFGFAAPQSGVDDVRHEFQQMLDAVRIAAAPN